jgi:hypothetical protein
MRREGQAMFEKAWPRGLVVVAHCFSDCKLAHSA